MDDVNKFLIIQYNVVENFTLTENFVEFQIVDERSCVTKIKREEKREKNNIQIHTQFSVLCIDFGLPGMNRPTNWRRTDCVHPVQHSDAFGVRMLFEWQLAISNKYPSHFDVWI